MCAHTLTPHIKHAEDDLIAIVSFKGYRTPEQVRSQLKKRLEELEREEIRKALLTPKEVEECLEIISLYF